MLEISVPTSWKQQVESAPPTPVPSEAVAAGDERERERERERGDKITSHSTGLFQKVLDSHPLELFGLEVFPDLQAWIKCNPWFPDPVFTFQGTGYAELGLTVFWSVISIRL
jgi:hypothetical protein